MRFLAAISGFGAFEKVLENPSGTLARRLAEQAPDGWDVRARELPVSFRRGPTAFDELLAGMDRAPDLLFAMGVHKKPGFRIERHHNFTVRAVRLTFLTSRSVATTTSR